MSLCGLIKNLWLLGGLLVAVALCDVYENLHFASRKRKGGGRCLGLDPDFQRRGRPGSSGWERSGVIDSVGGEEIFLLANTSHPVCETSGSNISGFISRATQFQVLEKLLLVSRCRQNDQPTC